MGFAFAAWALGFSDKDVLACSASFVDPFLVGDNGDGMDEKSVTDGD